MQKTLDDLPQLGRSRRRFIGRVGAASAGVGLLQLAAQAAEQVDALAKTPAPEHPVAATPQQPPRYGMLIDTQKCSSGCRACVDGCNAEHGLDGFDAPLTDAQWIRKVELRHNSTSREVSLPVLCQHCEDPPCVDVCPTGASFKRADGLVLVDKHICIGCRYCMMACPYKARSFVHENLTEQVPQAPRGKGVVESCTLCVHRIDSQASPEPACAQACREAGFSAIQFGNLNDANSPLAVRLRAEPSRELRADLALNTGVRYQGL